MGVPAQLCMRRKVNTHGEVVWEASASQTPCLLLVCELYIPQTISGLGIALFTGWLYRLWIVCGAGSSWTLVCGWSFGDRCD